MNKIFMKKITFILIGIFCVGSTLFAQDQMVLDENAQLRSIGAFFNKIEIADNIKLVLNQSEETALAVSAAEEKFISDIKTAVENNVLKISRVGSQSWSSKNRKYTVYLSFKELSMIKASGAAEVVVIGAIRSPHLNITLSGASDLRGTFRADSLYMDLSGASEAKMSGKADILNMECSGASDFEGYNLVVENCMVNVSGASDVYVTINKSLTGNASGASNLYYRGAVSVTELKKSGASDIKRTDR